MNNFGVYELASAKTTSAPGWAYVPDVGQRPATILQPANRKRARNPNAPSANVGDLSARQEARKQKEAEKLDKDGNRDNTIPVPSQNEKKHTANVRKILQSQKTFANHLDDYVALQALADSSTNTTNTNQNRRPASHITSNTTSTAHELQDLEKHPMLTGPIIPPLALDPPPSLPGDTNPLLMTPLPAMPSEDEMRRLLAHPPLSYLEARGHWKSGDGEGGYPVRRFCELCGYWGRVRCMKCGTRVCALDCLEQHRDHCERRYA